MAVEPVVERADIAFKDLVLWIQAHKREHGSAVTVLNGITIDLALSRYDKPRPGFVVRLEPLTPDNDVCAYLSLREHEAVLSVTGGPLYIMNGRPMTSTGSRIVLLAEVLTTLDPYIDYPKDI